MTIYYLYVKTHNITGLKYLGQTSKQDPYNYRGSGKDWITHLVEHGSDISTEILAECKTKHELNSVGRFYSTYYKVTTAMDDFGNRIWANRIPETGGGSIPTEQTREKLRDSQLGRKKPQRTPEHTERQAATMRGRPNPKTADGLKKWYATNPDRSDTFRKQSVELRKWYVEHPDKASEKADKTWNSRVMADYERLDTVNDLILEGLTNTEIQSKIKIDYATIKKLRNRTHRFFSIIK